MKDTNKALPQTGEQQDTINTGLIGGLLTAIGLGMLVGRKRKKD